MDIEAEIRRTAKLLETEIHIAGTSKRAIEKQLKVAAGYLTKVVKGGIEFRLRHVLQVAEVTGFDVAEFFHKAFPRQPSEGDARLLTILESDLTKKINRALAEQLQPVLDQLAAIRAALPPGPPEPETLGPKPKRTKGPTKGSIKKARSPKRRS